MGCTDLINDEILSEDERDRYYDPQFIYFSGFKQGSEAYILWEEDLEHWFRSQRIPKEERLSYALDTLVGEAQEWWQQEEFRSQYSQPINTWGLLKQSMYRTFVPKTLNKNYTPKKFLFQSAPKDKSIPKQPYNSKLKKKSTGKELVSRTKLHEEGEYDEDLKSANNMLVEFGPQLTRKLKDLDECALKDGFREDEEETINKVTFYGFLTQYESSENLNQVKISSESEEINFTRPVSLNSPGLDLRSLIGTLRSNQKELGCKTTWHELLCIEDLQIVPRYSSFGPKLSRYKESSHFPYLAKFEH